MVKKSAHDPLVSIIVPAYNAECTVSRCLDSLVEQSYSNIEIIIINDGSADRTKEICLSYCMRYQYIRLINQDNRGQSSARNTGIASASGDYLMFCDSDDFVSVKMVDYLVNIAKETNSDIVECSYSICNGNYASQKKYIDTLENSGHSFSLEGVDSIVRFVLDYGLNTVAPWGKLFAADLFKENRFQVELTKFEDDAIMPYLAESAKKYSRIDLPLYAYCIRENSVMTSPYSSKNLQLIDIFDTRLKYFGEKYGEDYVALIKYRYLLAMNDMIGTYAQEMNSIDYSIIDNKRKYLLKSIHSFAGVKRKSIAILSTIFPCAVHSFRAVIKSKEFTVKK